MTKAQNKWSLKLLNSIHENAIILKSMEEICHLNSYIQFDINYLVKCISNSQMLLINK